MSPQRFDHDSRASELPTSPSGPAGTGDTQTLDSAGRTADDGSPRTGRGAEAAGTSIGPYRLVELVGAGGMGDVWLADQAAPVRRRVALKLIKLGMDTRQVVARFDQERQALALMDHPGIARVFDAGATESGRPYFVMELVHGDPITTYCERQALPPRARLELFVHVCQAVQHAHNKGIIHRDLKPSNVLVTTVDGKPLPKVIDFGIAKAAVADDAQMTLFTEHSQLIGTPAYMSPEQAALGAVDVDTRSDVYSLGVLLYELLTGTLPFDPKTLRRKSVAQLQQIIREVEPPRPSTRLRQLSGGSSSSSGDAVRRPGGDPRVLGRALRGDLDWIVMKALEKDRTRRYETASDLAADVNRHLAGEPVIAAPPSRAYRLRKLVRRNAGLVAAAAAVAAALLVGLGLATFGLLQARASEGQARAAERQARDAESQALLAAEYARQAERQAEAERDRARIEATKAAQTATFVQTILSGIEPAIARGRDVTLLRTILDQTAERVAKELADQPAVAASILYTLGKAYSSIGAYDQASAQLDAAAALHAALGTGDTAETLRIAHAQATNTHLPGRHAQAEALFRDVMARQRAVLGADHADTLASERELGWLLMRLGRHVESEALLRESLERHNRVLGPEHAATLQCMANLCYAVSYQGRTAEAEALARQVLEARRRVLGENHPHTLGSVASLASVLESLDRHDEAIALHREALAALQRINGPEHPETLKQMNNLGAAFHEAERYDEAQAQHRDVLALRTRVLGADHPETIFSLANLANALFRGGKTAEAETCARQALEARRRTLGEDHVDTVKSYESLGHILSGQRRFSEAAECLEKIAHFNRRTRSESDSAVALSYYNWAATLQNAGDNEKAEGVLRTVLELQEKTDRKDRPFVAAAHNALGKTLAARQCFAEADACFREGLAMRRRLFGDKPHRETAYSLADWGVVLMEQKRLAEAEPLLREYLAYRRSAAPQADVLLGEANGYLGATLSELGRFDEAEKLLLRSDSILQGAPGASETQRLRTVEWLVAHFEARAEADPQGGFEEKAAHWRSRLEPTSPLD